MENSFRLPLGLPDLVKAHIASFYWSPQPPELMRDIRDYVSSLEVVTDIYRARCGDEYKDAEHDWLINDIQGFLNEDLATMYGYTNNFYKLWEKYLKENIWGWNSVVSKLMKTAWRPPVPPPNGPYRYTIPPFTRSYIDAYLTCFEKISAKIEGRIFWAVMSPEMRTLFIATQE